MRGIAATGLTTVVAGSDRPAVSEKQQGGPGPAGEPGNAAAVPFYGEHQAGIINPPPNSRQVVGNFVAFDVTAVSRKGLADLFRTLTAQAAFLTAGGKAPTASPGSPQPDDGIMGPRIPADALTVTVGVGASLFDGRYGLAASKPAQLVAMSFRHDNLNPALSDGDLLVQLCAGSRDTPGGAGVSRMQRSASQHAQPMLEIEHGLLRQHVGPQRHHRTAAGLEWPV